MNDAFPEMIEVINEHGVRIQKPVEFEWSPIKCTGCGMMGHDV